MMCVGPPMSGKTSFVMRLVENQDRLIDKPFDYIYWFYGERSKTIDALEEETPTAATAKKKQQTPIKVVAGLPENIDEFIADPAAETGAGDGNAPGEPPHGLFIFDDLMHAISSSENISRLATNKTQHKRVSWIVLMQNLFHRGQARLTLLRSCHYLVLFKNPLDKSLGHLLAPRVMPGESKTFVKIYEEATKQPHGYLFIDGHQETPNELRLRSQLFDEAQRIFIPAGKN